MKYLRWIGLAMSLLGIGFIVVQLGAYADDLRDFRPTIVLNRAITAGGDTLFYFFALALGSPK